MLEVFRKIQHNISGWRTTQKIIVIESDDWGSIRMPSLDVYNKCLRSGYRVDLRPYERYDSLASKDDLELLFDLLLSFKDQKGSNPKITANCVVANPDFDKIKESNYKEYHYELISETFKKYPNHSNNFEIWNKGHTEGIFCLQYHGREHLNARAFMEALRRNDEDAIFAFEHKMPGIIPKGSKHLGNSYVDAYRSFSKTHKGEILEAIIDGLNLFEKLFGFRSSSIMPINYTWSNDFNGPVSQHGVRLLQGVRKYRESLVEPGNQKFGKRILGNENVYGQMDLIRNCSFEPTVYTNLDAVDSCLKEINLAFLLSKPVVISSHRLNYVGSIDLHNRDRNLVLLNSLLSRILSKWPEVHFMSTVELGHFIKSN